MAYNGDAVGQIRNLLTRVMHPRIEKILLRFLCTREVSGDSLPN